MTLSGRHWSFISVMFVVASCRRRLFSNQSFSHPPFRIQCYARLFDNNNNNNETCPSSKTQQPQTVIHNCHTHIFIYIYKHTQMHTHKRHWWCLRNCQSWNRYHGHGNKISRIAHEEHHSRRHGWCFGHLRSHCSCYFERKDEHARCHY